MKQKKSGQDVCKSGLATVIVVGLVGLCVGAGVGFLVGRAYAPSIADYEMICTDGAAADANGCCPGEVYTDMGDRGFNCCPETGGNCFPPMK